MASPSSSADPTPLEVPPWLKSLPLAPEYRPTLAEFADPISFILKIEKEASAFGICKIVPPLPPPPKKTTLSNLNRSFAARDPSPKKPPTFTTRQQQIGFCPRRPRPVQKPVWQSGETYTLHQFEAKAKQFERAQIKKYGRKTPFSPLELESLFWRACADKPFSVEYANDMPGSGFAPIVRKWCKEEEAGNVGESGWNMRGVSRAKGSLLRFMKEEIPGVTSPMVYVAMMFSWFAWHVEDHELHSLNYLHMGAGKTWYGVPRDAALAVEDVVRVEGYGGEVNPLVTFTILGEKTTVMSPEVLVGKGIPCCRLVQNAGEFVVTFPGAYHSGFSHGFNCAEAANIATPGWLTVAKEAAIRRASINYPPMVSHFQLLYALALSLCSRVPLIGVSEPRSSRLKDKMRGEGEVMVKEIFVQNVIETNELLSILLSKGSSCIVLPQNTHDIPLCSNSLARSQLKMKPRLSLGLCSREEALEASRVFPSNDVMLGRNAGTGHSSGSYASKGIYLSVCQASATSDKSGNSAYNSSASDSQHVENEKENAVHSDGLLDHGLLSCVTCGILSFTCVAVVQPREPAARYLMSADCGFLNDQNIGFGENSDRDNETNWRRSTSDLLCGSGQLENHIEERDTDELVHCTSFSRHVLDRSVEGDGSGAGGQGGASALALLASVYGDSSDSEEEVLPATSPCTDEINDPNHEARYANIDNHAAAKNDLYNEYSHCTGGYGHMNGSRSASPAERCRSRSASPAETCQTRSASPAEICRSRSERYRSRSASPMGRCRSRSASPKERRRLTPEFSEGDQPGMVDNLDGEETETSSSSIKSMGEAIDVDYEGLHSNCHTTETTDLHQSDVKMGRIASESPSIFKESDASYAPAAATENSARTSTSRNFDTSRQNSNISAIERSNRDSSRMHVFCLEHALEVEKLLHPIGGVNIMILCHSDYPKIESEAKLLADELESDYEWKNIDFRGPTLKDLQSIRAALEDEESMPTSSDWAVKLGINLFYSANLSKSPLYSKQMPYNTVIYNAFGCSLPNNSPVKTKPNKRKPGRQRKIVVAGKWCGKVWMTNQVHPFIANRKDAQEKKLAERLHSKSNTDTKSEDVETEIRTKRTVSKKKSSGDNVSSAMRRSVKRKKQPVGSASVKKPKCTPQVMDKKLQGSNYATSERSSTQSPMVLRSCRKLNVKYEPDEGPSTVRSNRRLKVKDEAEQEVSTPRNNCKFAEDVDDGGPSTRLRTRPSTSKETKTSLTSKKQFGKKKAEKKVKTAANPVKEDEEVGEYPCNIEGCTMSFSTKHDLTLHKKDICPEEGCGKKFFSHKYLLQHRKVHMDDRPLACPWKGCKMRFKWAWARTEHIRVHTGDRPYICRECSQTFRFVSDFSRHKRKTGHVSKKGRR